jgi:hypothetical protein
MPGWRRGVGAPRYVLQKISRPCAFPSGGPCDEVAETDVREAGEHRKEVRPPEKDLKAHLFGVSVSRGAPSRTLRGRAS